MHEKLIKLVYTDDVSVVDNNDGTLTFKRTLAPLESKQVLECIFGTTDVGIIDCSDIKEDLYYCPTCQRILDLTEIDSCMNTPNEIIDYCLRCQSEVINLKDDK